MLGETRELQIASRTPARTLPLNAGGLGERSPPGVCTTLHSRFCWPRSSCPGTYPEALLSVHITCLLAPRALAGGTHEAANLQSLPRGSTPAGRPQVDLGALTWDTVMPHFLASSSLASSLGYGLLRWE